MIFEFSNYQLDTDRRELSGASGPIPLQPQAFSLLVYLIENADRVVSKDEIFEAVWEGRIVGDGTLNARINSIRTATGDDGSRQAIVKTLPRQGFRFVAPLTQGEVNSPKPILESKNSSPSLTVLPFLDAGLDPDFKFLADGLTEDLVTALSKRRGFFVTDRSTTFALKGGVDDPRELAAEMGVRYVLQGSVRSADTRIRVNASLTDTESGTQLWAERCDRELTDIFDLQDELTEGLVARLSPELFAAEHARLKRRPPSSLDAWECFVHAIHEYGRQSNESSASAVALLERAIEIDPDYAQALGLCATTLAWRVIQGWEPRDDTLGRARAAADRAVLSDPNDAWASIGRGYVSLTSREEHAAIMNFGRAVDLSPNFAFARSLLGVSNAYAGNADIARKHIERAIVLSPRDTFIDKFYLYLSVAEFQAARYDAAADAAEQAIQLKPAHPSSHLWRASALALGGHQDRAETACKSYQDLVPSARASQIEHRVLYYRPEDRNRLVDGARLAGLPEQ